MKPLRTRPGTRGPLGGNTPRREGNRILPLRAPRGILRTVSRPLREPARPDEVCRPISCFARKNGIGKNLKRLASPSGSLRSRSPGVAPMGQTPFWAPRVVEQSRIRLLPMVLPRSLRLQLPRPATPSITHYVKDVKHKNLFSKCVVVVILTLSGRGCQCLSCIKSRMPACMIVEFPPCAFHICSHNLFWGGTVFLDFIRKTSGPLPT